MNIFTLVAGIIIFCRTGLNILVLLSFFLNNKLNCFKFWIHYFLFVLFLMILDIFLFRSEFKLKCFMNIFALVEGSIILIFRTRFKLKCFMNIFALVKSSIILIFRSRFKLKRFMNILTLVAGIIIFCRSGLNILVLLSFFLNFWIHYFLFVLFQNLRKLWILIFLFVFFRFLFLY